MTEKTILLTGATSGIGLEAAVGIARLGADLIIVARNSAKGEGRAVDRIDPSTMAAVATALIKGNPENAKALLGASLVPPRPGRHGLLK